MEKTFDRAFYRRILSVAMPIIIQNGITNFVSMLDNVMVGQVGTVPMSGVAIVNQLLFVFNLCVFGAVSGAGIFTAQFYGSDDSEGVRYTFRFKLLIGLLLTAAGVAVFTLGGKGLIGLYLEGDGDLTAAAATMEYGWNYLIVMLWGLLPYHFHLFLLQYILHCKLLFHLLLFYYQMSHHRMLNMHYFLPIHPEAHRL